MEQVVLPSTLWVALLTKPVVQVVQVRLLADTGDMGLEGEVVGGRIAAEWCSYLYSL